MRLKPGLLFSLVAALSSAQVFDSHNAYRIRGVPFTIVGKGAMDGSGGSAWTSSCGGLCGTKTISVTGALTTDSVLCTITSNTITGAGPVSVRVLICQISANGTLTAKQIYADGSAYDTFMSFNWMVLR